jgi:hypothetical protein
MKKIILAVFTVIAFGSCRENACLKYVKMSGKAVQNSLSVTGQTGKELAIPRQNGLPTTDLSLLHPMESGVDRLTR